MTKTARTLIWLASLAFAATSLPCGAVEKKADCIAARGRAPIKIESRCMRLQYDGETRTYRIYKPHTAATSPLPLLLALHGGGGSGAAMEGLTLGQFNRIADKHNVIVVYPDGVGRTWNDGRSDLKSQAVREGVDDVGFLRAVIADVANQQRVDRKRVYVTGISNGGLMAFRLACEATNMIAAIAPVAANLSVELSRECRPARMIPMVMISGTDDPLMPWLGGDIKVLWSSRGEVLSAQDTFEHWAKLGDCAIPTTHMQRDKVPDDGTSLVRHIARECTNKTEVRLYEILGGGHTWPSGHQYLGPRIVGKVSRELNASEEIWSFVSRFSAP